MSLISKAANAAISRATRPTVVKSTVEYMPGYCIGCNKRVRGAMHCKKPTCHRAAARYIG